MAREKEPEYGPISRRYLVIEAGCLRRREGLVGALRARRCRARRGEVELGRLT